MEFLSTFWIEKPNMCHGINNTVGFEVYRNFHKLTMIEFCVRMSLYSEDYTHINEFKHTISMAKGYYSLILLEGID